MLNHSLEAAHLQTLRYNALSVSSFWRMLQRSGKVFHVKYKTSSLKVFCSMEPPSIARCQNYSKGRENRLWNKKDTW